MLNVSALVCLFSSILTSPKIGAIISAFASNIKINETNRLKTRTEFLQSIDETGAEDTPQFYTNRKQLLQIL